MFVYVFMFLQPLSFKLFKSAQRHSLGQYKITAYYVLHIIYKIEVKITGKVDPEKMQFLRLCLLCPIETFFGSHSK